MTHRDLQRQLLDLPIELLPEIFQNLYHPTHLSSTSLVNKNFHYFATPILYRNVRIFSWHANAKHKIRKLFTTLALYPHLARYLHTLDLRDFPKGLPPSSSQDLHTLCIHALKNCTHLQTVSWTRDGSLSTSTLLALQSLPNLKELEINGHHDGHYDATALTGFERLEKLSLLMPTPGVISVLPRWMKGTGGTLSSLHLIFKSSPCVKNMTLETIAPYLPNLKSFHIIGCTRVTHIGVLLILSASEVGISDLTLAGLSENFSMEKFAHQCSIYHDHDPNRSNRPHLLSALSSITLNFSKETISPTWLAHVNILLHSSPLRKFRLSMSFKEGEIPSSVSDSGETGSHLDEDFVRSFVTRHGGTILQLGVVQMQLAIPILDHICRNCKKLEQLFVAVSRVSVPTIPQSISHLPNLRTLHIYYPTHQGRSFPVLTRESLVSIVKQCSPMGKLSQFGIQTRAWQVIRTGTRMPNGEVETETTLGPYEFLEIPEVFLVVRV